MFDRVISSLWHWGGQVTGFSNWLDSPAHVYQVSLKNLAESFAVAKPSWPTLTTIEPSSPLVLHNVRIPLAYTPIPRSRVSEMNPEDVRFFEPGDEPFHFNRYHLSYQRLLFQCRSDSKALEKALVKEIKTRELPIWVSRKARPLSKKNHRRMSFPIRPPFFRSEVSDKKGCRMQGDDSQDVFMLHFDENHRIQFCRYWAHSKYVDNLWRQCLACELKSIDVELSRSYGHWDEMAKLIADVVEKCFWDFQTLQKTLFETSSENS